MPDREEMDKGAMTREQAIKALVETGFTREEAEKYLDETVTWKRWLILDQVEKRLKGGK